MKLSEVSLLTKDQAIEKLTRLLKATSGKLWTQEGWLKVMADETSILQHRLLGIPDSEKVLPGVVDALDIIEEELIEIADRIRFLGDKLARTHNNLLLEEPRK